MSDEQEIAEDLQDKQIVELQSKIDFLTEQNEFQFNEIIKVRDAGNERVRIWQQELEMYQNAWLRELGGKLVPKHHFIDALVLTTRNLLESKKSLQQELSAAEASNRRLVGLLKDLRPGVSVLATMTRVAELQMGKLAAIELLAHIDAALAAVPHSH